MNDDGFLRWLAEANGYVMPRAIAGGRWAAIVPHFDPSTGIVVGRIGDSFGWSEKWTYPSAVEAIVAFAAWDGTGEPVGWIRHQPSNRRISRSPDEGDENGNRVGAVGVVYIRP